MNMQKDRPMLFSSCFLDNSLRFIIGSYISKIELYTRNWYSVRYGFNVIITNQEMRGVTHATFEELLLQVDL
jgi:hypothetical protein